MTVAELVRGCRRMKKKYASVLIVFAIGGIALAQESPSPIPSPSASPEQSPSPSPSASASRNVQLRFVPPPMEGTISLGIFDSNDKLVRVLHREAKIDNFTIDENALRTTWDGKNDAGEDLPPGKYRARAKEKAKPEERTIIKGSNIPIKEVWPDPPYLIDPITADGDMNHSWVL